MKHGDFTLLAKNYKHRTGYSDEAFAMAIKSAELVLQMYSDEQASP